MIQIYEHFIKFQIWPSVDSPYSSYKRIVGIPGDMLLFTLVDGKKKMKIKNK